MWFNPKHLQDAKYKAGKGHLTGIFGYWWHFKLAIMEFFFLVLICIGSLIHAICPWVLDFKLLTWRINRLRYLKKRIPDDEALKKIHFDD
tara:strand:- start:124 stop:393 length:270 start_codon:yes stop_codon:yes gene_type:complete